MAAAVLVSCGAAACLATAPASADPTTDQVTQILETLMAGSSDGGVAPIIASPNGVTAIQVTTERYSHGGFGGAGKKIGPDLYALSSGKFTPGIEYNAVTSAGGKNRADNCQIEIQMTGPQTSQVLKTANCSGYKGTGVITATGRYTAKVIDRVSGRTGFSSFTIQ